MVSFLYDLIGALIDFLISICYFFAGALLVSGLLYGVIFVLTIIASFY